ncbi:Uncharacterised protein [Vibrio cholerae]|nr:Uncharacterised protein [Vibrio cholerae]
MADIFGARGSSLVFPVVSLNSVFKSPRLAKSSSEEVAYQRDPISAP